MTNIEDRLTDALASRAAEVDPASVRLLAEQSEQAEPAAPGRAKRRAIWLAPLAAAASVLLVVAAVAFLAVRDPRDPKGSRPLDLPSGGPAITGQLNALAVLAPNDVWAVGYQLTERVKCSNVGYKALIEHWNGHRWQRAKTPALPCGRIMLNSVAATAPDDVWAVGSLNDIQFQPIIMYWNGHRWSLAQLPFVPNTSVGGLFDVDAISATDVWAVGQGSTDRAALILHWNGSRWLRITAHLSGELQVLDGIAAPAPDDDWAVGTDGRHVNTGVIVHSTGHGWSTDLQLNQTHLWGLSAPSADDIWALGQRTIGADCTVILHFSGNGWQSEPTPALPSFSCVDSIAATSATDVWAVGGGGSSTKTWLLHWNGSRWSRNLIPAFQATIGQQSLVVRSPDDIWVTGYKGTWPDGAAVIMHWNGAAWSRVFGPAKTPTPTPTATPTTGA
jgi:hypothetical protein